jgi:RNA polymerase sigma factor (sigma-70 family)
MCKLTHGRPVRWTDSWEAPRGSARPACAEGRAGIPPIFDGSDSFDVLLTKTLPSAAFSSMVRKVHRRLSRFLDPIIDLDDFRQIVLTHAWQKRAAFRWQGESEFLRWLRSLACQLANYLLRGASRQVPGLLPEEWPDSADTPQQALQSAEEHACLAAARTRLHPAEQDVLQRHYECKESLVKIANLLGEQEDTIRNRHHRALAKLHQMLES